MAAPETLRTLTAFARDRWGTHARDRAGLERRQARGLRRFLDEVVTRAPYYRGRGTTVAALPIVDKATMLANFVGFNTVGVTLDQALSVAEAAERDRNFAPTLPGGIAVGLSSGTSGRRGVFLVSAAERATWAGVLLSRLLTPASLRQVLRPSAPPLHIAFFLRANSRLYTSLQSRRIAFVFHDLLEPIEHHAVLLNADPPDVLAAPPTVLRRLAELASTRALRIAPRQVVSVAEVLEHDDAAAIEAAWHVKAQEVYQATEGFLGATCRVGSLHLNEDLLHIEPEWLDAACTRFQPIVTDFSRTTQLIVRYRLDDVLRVADTPCGCGAPTLTLAAVEGRADDVLDGLTAVGRVVPMFPDLVRRAMALVLGLDDYRIEQHGPTWRVRTHACEPSLHQTIERECRSLATQLGIAAPVLQFDAWVEEPLTVKRRRIRRVAGLTAGASGSTDA